MAAVPGAWEDPTPPISDSSTTSNKNWEGDRIGSTHRKSFLSPEEEKAQSRLMGEKRNKVRRGSRTQEFVCSLFFCVWEKLACEAPSRSLHGRGRMGTR